jgi:hypothetical protein
VVDNREMGVEGMSDMTTGTPNNTPERASPVQAAGDDAGHDGLAALAAVVLTAALIVFLVSRII